MIGRYDAARLAIPSLAMFFAVSVASLAHGEDASERVNAWRADEFQFKFVFNNPLASGGKKESDQSDVYLYIPAEARTVRALLLLQQNVVEQKVSVHPAIRRVCDANAIAIAWCQPGFDLTFSQNAHELHDLVTQQFGAFGQSIGYPELGNAPLITFGHSNTTHYAQNAAEARPDRVLAAIVTHGWDRGVGTLHAYEGPVLLFQGQRSEWRQPEKQNLPTRPIQSLSRMRERLESGWMPISIVDESRSGHFDYSEAIMGFFALYIDKAMAARLGDGGELRPLDPDAGYIARVSDVPSGEIVVTSSSDATPEERATSPWYFDKELAEAAATIIAGNGPWTREPQFIGFEHPDGSEAVFGKSGLVTLPYTIRPGTNRIQLSPKLLEAMPTGFEEAGQPLCIASDPTITVEYNCGAYLYLDRDGNYRVQLNRSYPDGYGYLVARHRGDDHCAPTVQPVHWNFWKGRADHSVPMLTPGPQHPGAVIDLDTGAVGEQYKGYYVDHGPARVVDNQLIILPLPANTVGPVEVELVAYTLGHTVTGVSRTTFLVEP